MDITAIITSVRTEFNEPTTRRIADTDILRAANDGYKDIAAKAFCVERRFKLPTVPGSRTILFPWCIRLNYVEHIPAAITADPGFDYVAADPDDYTWTDSDYEIYRGGEIPNEVLVESNSLVRITPGCAGNINVNGFDPQYWFTWGRYLCIEPIPADVHWLRLYIAQYPAKTLKIGVDETPVDLPIEFRECLLDFVLYTLAIKMRRWSLVALYYNRYISGIQRRRWEYIQKRVNSKADMAVPKSVTFTV